MIRRLTALLLPLLLLAGCASQAPAPPRAAAWLGSQSGRLILRVVAEDALRSLALTAPDGRAFAPDRLDATQPDRTALPARPGVGIGGSAGSRGGSDVGIGISLPIANPFGREVTRPVASEAQFTLPPEALTLYRTRPQDWRLDLGLPGRAVSLPAPPLQP